jgi:sigma-B regulation protein RsbU (phosphoserine phosphatase)
MKKIKVRISLRYKLLLALTLIPVTCLSLYLAMATDLFRKDKIAYVFDSSAAVSHSIAAQTRLELDNLFDNLRPICEAFIPETHEFNATGKYLFEKQKNIRAIGIFQKDPVKGYVLSGSLLRDAEKDKVFLETAVVMNQLRDQALLHTSFVTQLHQKAFDGMVGVSFRAGEVTDPKHSIIVSLYSSEDLLSNYENTGLYHTYLVGKNDASIAFGPDTEMILENLTSKLQSQLPEGTAAMPGKDGENYLMSYAQTGIGDLSVVSYVNEKRALKAVEVLVMKSIMFFIALIATTVIISVVASGKLTAQLQELFEATDKIAHGDFSVKVEPQSNDEIGVLAQNFTIMAGEISRLMADTAQKARMENELATVRTVQETLFPPSTMSFGTLDIVGHFEPASECGGDWWNYSKVGDKVFLWIGDATGHGAPAALITSAARSAAAVIETFPDITPAHGLKVLNHAIHQTSKGKINMTFFLGCLDLTTGKFRYSSASHDPPYWMKKRPGTMLKKKDLIPLMDVNGLRLGEKPDTTYEEAEIQLEAGDMIFFYTDGIMDIQTPTFEKWGERVFLKTLLESANAEVGIEEKVTQLRKKANDYRQGAELIDDVTLFMVEYKPAVAMKEAS